jgi:hypothetical protein
VAIGRGEGAERGGDAPGNRGNTWLTGSSRAIGHPPRLACCGRNEDGAACRLAFCFTWPDCQIARLPAWTPDCQVGPLPTPSAGWRWPLRACLFLPARHTCSTHTTCIPDTARLPQSSGTARLPDCQIASLNVGWAASCGVPRNGCYGPWWLIASIAEEPVAYYSSLTNTQFCPRTVAPILPRRIARLPVPDCQIGRASACMVATIRMHGCFDLLCLCREEYVEMQYDPAVVTEIEGTRYSHCLRGMFTCRRSPHVSCVLCCRLSIPLLPG